MRGKASIPYIHSIVGVLGRLGRSHNVQSYSGVMVMVRTDLAGGLHQNVCYSMDIPRPESIGEPI